MIAPRLLSLAIGALICGAVTVWPALAHTPQGLLAPGDAAVTGFSGALPPEAIAPGSDPADRTVIDPQGPSLRVIDLANMNGPAQAQLVQAPKPFTATAAQIGQVFAVALDDARPPNIYAAASSAYGLPIVAADGTRLKTGALGARFMPGLFGPAPDGGPGSIWKIDGVTGQVSLFANVTLDGLPNSGAALGGMAFDARTTSLFVVDRGTGVIHRFALDGREIGRYDHGTQGRQAIKLPPVAYAPQAQLDITVANFASQDPGTWGYAPPERRIFGLGIAGERLYYAVAGGMQLWSVAIGPEDFGANPRIEVVIPPSKGVVEISKIVFDAQGRMYVSERPAPTGAHDFEALTKEGIGRVLRYVAQEGLPTLPPAWQQNPAEYAIGFPLELRNGNGGVDLGYRYTPQGMIDRSSCGGYLWSTGEQLRKSPDPARAAQLAQSGPPIVDGLQGNAIELLRPQNVPPTRTYFIDYDDHTDDAAARGHLGDIAIWRACGPDFRRAGGAGTPGAAGAGGSLGSDWWQAGWYGPPAKFPPNICAADQQQPGFQCCPSGTSPGPNGQCQSWCPDNALDPNSVKHCALGYDPKGYNPDDPASWTCLDGSKPDAALILDPKTAPYACIAKSPLHNAASCPAGLVKADLGSVDPKLVGLTHCEKTPAQAACAPGSQLGLDNECHQLCAAGGFAWPAAQCCAAGSVVSVSGKCCPPGSKVDGKTGQCNPPQGCQPGNVKVGGKCCLVENVGMEAKVGIKSYMCCPNGADPNTGYCLPPPVQISDLCPVAQKSSVDGACCPVGQVPNNVIGGCCPPGSSPQGSAGACICAGGAQPVKGACPKPGDQAACEADPKKAMAGGVCCDKSQVAGGQCCPAGSTPEGNLCKPPTIVINFICQEGETLLKDGKTCCPTGQISGGKCCPAGSAPTDDKGSCGPAAVEHIKAKAKCPDGKLMPADQICLIDAVACSAAGPGAVAYPGGLIHGAGAACCPAGYQPQQSGGCANGPLPLCPAGQKLDPLHHVCLCLDGSAVPADKKCPALKAASACAPGLVKKGDICVCPSTGQPMVQKVGGGFTCDPPAPTAAACAPRFLSASDGTCCRADLLTGNGRCCTGGTVPDPHRSASCMTPACASGMHWDAEKKTCIGNVAVQPSCPPGAHWSIMRKICLPDPKQCGAGTHWDSAQGACVADARVVNAAREPSCSAGTHRDARGRGCVANASKPKLPERPQVQHQRPRPSYHAPRPPQGRVVSAVSRPSHGGAGANLKRR
jgi:hypothetical protein